ncbi:MAG TPA: dephospho-CoA kinase, partial [Pyrinomonadaceae bacterium]|nr:dephospho-CoA kinase [Pyrinomonadaceae bacterium]
REVVVPGSPGLAAVVETFGADVLASDGTLDRKRLGELVFRDEAKRRLLNSILHPFIIERQDQQIRAWESEDPNGIAVVDAALMIESGGYSRFDKLIVVYCRPEIQLQRIMKREGFSLEEAKRRIAAQMSQEEKLKFADFRIDTSGEFDQTRIQVEEVYRELQLLSGKQQLNPVASKRARFETPGKNR